MTPALVHFPRDWQLPWQWRHPTPTRDLLEYARPEDSSSTYIAGFPTETAALNYGRRNGWVHD